MATQVGITVAAANEPYKVVKDIPRHKPGHKQVLVKSLATSINPVDPWMQHTGALIASWPAVLGCDASGVVIEAGLGCTKLKVGDHVLGCTRVGQSECSTFQQTHLMDEDLTFKRPRHVSSEEASTIGVGLDTSALALISGAGLSLSSPGTEPSSKDEWVIILGSSGSVGQFGVRLAVLAGYKVLASCSPSKSAIPKKHGARATLHNRLPVDEQLAEIKKVTGGNFSYIFDASGHGAELSFKALQTVSTRSRKWFGTVDDFSPLEFPAGLDNYRVQLGAMGHKEEHPRGMWTTDAVKKFVPILQPHLDNGSIQPIDYELVDGLGWESIIKGIELLESGKSGKKVVAKVQDE